MKIGKPTGNEVTNLATTAGGVFVGSKASKGVSALIPMDNSTTKQLVVGAGGVVLATFTKGKDGLSNFVRGLGIGMATEQLGKFIDNAVGDKLPDNKAIKAAFGHDTVAVADTKKALAAYRRRRSLNMPMSSETTMYNNSGGLVAG